MKCFFLWLEENDKRTRKVLAIFTAIVWLFATIASYTLYTQGYDTLALYSLVTAQFATVIGFYMVSNAKTD